jgi:hypothetical protein
MATLGNQAARSRPGTLAPELLTVLATTVIGLTVVLCLVRGALLANLVGEADVLKADPARIHVDIKAVERIPGRFDVAAVERFRRAHLDVDAVEHFARAHLDADAVERFSRAHLDVDAVEHFARAHLDADAVERFSREHFNIEAVERYSRGSRYYDDSGGGGLTAGSTAPTVAPESPVD